MQKILISACLLGYRVRYNGGSLAISDPAFDWVMQNCEAVSFCPEVAGGLPTPRAPAEIQTGSGEILVKTNTDADVTEPFLQGARSALAICQSENIRFAILTESSPSCGSTAIYDGTFTGNKIAGEGVTTALLQKHGIKVFSQHSVDKLKNLLELDLLS